MNRALDFSLALVGLIVASPILMLAMAAIWLQDFRSPFYIAPRMARGGGTFRIVKFRSMVINAETIGGISTANSDRRITPVGKFIRKYKIDDPRTHSPPGHGDSPARGRHSARRT